MRLASLHRSLSRLAVIAMLLIVLAPLVSRWVMHGSHADHRETVRMPALASPAPQAHHGSHHPHGDGHAPEPMMSEAHAHPAPVAAPVAPEAHAHKVHDKGGAASTDPHAGHDMGVDCDYCLIAARLVSLLVAVLLALIGWQAPCFARARALPWRTRITAGHLGARGPPRHA